MMPSLVIFLSHSKDPEGFLLDRVANLSDVAGVVRAVGLIRVVMQPFLKLKKTKLFHETILL